MIRDMVRECGVAVVFGQIFGAGRWAEIGLIMAGVLDWGKSAVKRKSLVATKPRTLAVRKLTGW